MAQDEPEPKQQTPKGHEVPVPKRLDFFRDLKKIADKPVPPPSDDSSPRK